MSTPERYAPIAESLADPGWCILPQFLSAQQVDALAAECRTAWNERAFRPAGVGSGDGWHLRPEVRGDHVLWLDQSDASPAQKDYLIQLESLRLAINSELYLGLFEFEGHLTVYPPGAFYRRHLDQFRAVAYRKVSCILYLNSEWRAEDGGALRLYTDPSDETFYQDVYPEGGTLVCFLSNLIHHEVLPAARERMSLTGWFRTRD